MAHLRLYRKNCNMSNSIYFSMYWLLFFVDLVYLQ